MLIQSVSIEKYMFFNYSIFVADRGMHSQQKEEAQMALSHLGTRQSQTEGSLQNF